MPRTSDPPAHDPGDRRFTKSIWFIVLIALALRLAVITVGHTYRITPRRDHFQFGWEMGRLARSIALGNGFSSPTDLPSGPSAWTAPVYPYFLAGVFKIFGTYTAASAWVILTFNSVFAALTCWTLFLTARRVFGEGAARVSAWTWAVFPYLIYWPVRVVWETSFTTFLLSLILWLTISMADRATRRDWIIYGLLWGLVLLTNTAVGTLLPCFLAWIVFRKGSAGQLTGAGLCIVILLACVSPWTARNYHVFRRLVFIRDNLPLELHEANNSASTGLWTRSEHPGNEPVSMKRFQELGEIGFMDEKSQQLRAFLREHPDKFLRFTLERVFYFWAAPPQATIVGGYDLWVARHVEFLLAAGFAFAGLILSFQRRNAHRWLLAPFLLIYPLPYYVVNPFPRYKHPIEPVMLMLIVYVFWESKSVQIGKAGRRSN